MAKYLQCVEATWVVIGEPKTENNMQPIETAEKYGLELCKEWLDERS